MLDYFWCSFYKSFTCVNTNHYASLVVFSCVSWTSVKGGKNLSWGGCRFVYDCVSLIDWCPQIADAHFLNFYGRLRRMSSYHKLSLCLWVASRTTLVKEHIMLTPHSNYLIKTFAKGLFMSLWLLIKKKGLCDSSALKSLQSWTLLTK